MFLAASGRESALTWWAIRIAIHFLARWHDVMQVTGALSLWLGSVALAQSASLARLHVTTDMPMCQRTIVYR
jgi:hypothetical protein